MSAETTDKLTYVALGTLTQLASPGYTIGDGSINCNDLSAWNTETLAIFGIDQVNALGVRIPGTYTEHSGIISGNTIGSLQLLGGNDQNYTAGATTRVYQLITAAWADALIDGLLLEHNANGTHNFPDGSVPTASLASDAGIVTAMVVDGAITPAKLLAGAGTSWPWQSFSPTITNLTVGNGTLATFYTQIGKTVHFRIVLTFGSTTILPTGADALVTWPVTPKDTTYNRFYQIGTGGLNNHSSGGIHNVFPAYYDQATMTIQLTRVDTGTNTLITDAIAAVNLPSVGTGSIMQICGTYEAA